MPNLKAKPQLHTNSSEPLEITHASETREQNNSNTIPQVGVPDVNGARAWVAPHVEVCCRLHVIEGTTLDLVHLIVVNVQVFDAHKAIKRRSLFKLESSTPTKY